MQIGNRFRLYPTPAQQSVLWAWIGCQRHIYNAKVREDRYFRSFARKSLAHTGEYAPIDQQYSQFKTELTPWLSEVPSQILRNGAVLWKAAYSRFFQKLGGRPCIHQRSGKQSVWITKELFEFKPVVDKSTGEILTYTLTLGTAKFPVGQLVLHAHRVFKPADSIHISVHAGRWHVSFNYDDGVPEPDEADTIAWLRQFSASELASMTVGLDRGVALPLATSDGRRFGFSAVQEKRLAAQERHKKRWQRRQARRTLGSKNWHKAKSKVARYQRYGADVRRDVAHKTSFNLVVEPQIKLLVFEALKVQNMTRRPKPKQDANGKWQRNGARAKAGLNKAILASTWGQTQVYCQYKAKRAGKLAITVPAHYSSQECARCGFVHSDNRPDQATFVCQRCGHRDHADHNAGVVIAQRGVKQLLSGAHAQKAKKKCAIRRNKVGGVTSEPMAQDRCLVPSTPGETTVRRTAGNSSTLTSMTQETAAIALA